jgi:hypothetical protein
LNNFLWLEHWFHGLCDGAWERTHSLTIETLTDRTGWIFKVNLNGTPFERTPDVILKEMRVSDRDWMVCRLIDGCFEGTGGPLMLGPILQTLRNWIENY